MYPFVTTSVLIFWHLPSSLIASYLLAAGPAHAVGMAATSESELLSAPAACPLAVPLTSVMMAVVPVRTMEVGGPG